MAKITRFRGDTRPISGVVNLNDIPQVVTGCTFVLTADPSKEPIDATNNLFALTGIVAGSALSFPITTLQADQVPGTYWYDIQMVDPLGQKDTIAHDKFVFLQDIGKQ